MAGSKIATIISATSSVMSYLFFIGSAVYYTYAGISHFSVDGEKHQFHAEITEVAIGSVFLVSGSLCAIASCCASRDDSMPLNGNIDAYEDA